VIRAIVVIAPTLRAGPTPRERPAEPGISGTTLSRPDDAAVRAKIEI
jgi:hypothetical protein